MTKMKRRKRMKMKGNLSRGHLLHLILVSTQTRWRKRNSNALRNSSRSKPSVSSKESKWPPKHRLWKSERCLRRPSRERPDNQLEALKITRTRIPLSLQRNKKAIETISLSSVQLLQEEALEVHLWVKLKAETMANLNKMKLLAKMRTSTTAGLTSLKISQTPPITVNSLNQWDNRSPSQLSTKRRWKQRNFHQHKTMLQMRTSFSSHLVWDQSLELAPGNFLQTGQLLMANRVRVQLAETPPHQPSQNSPQLYPRRHMPFHPIRRW